MRILQVSNRVPWPLNEGGTIGIYNFTKAFAEEGHEVYLYCLDGLKHNTPLKEAERELSKYAKVYFHSIDTDVKVDDALKNLFSRRSYNVERFDNESFKIELAELLSKERFDVVQLEGTFAGPYVDVIKKHHKGLLSLRMHNVEYEIWERLALNTNNPLKSNYLKLLAKRLKKYETELLKKVDAVIPVTETDKQKFVGLNKEQEYLVIPAGIDEEYWEYTPSSSIKNWYHLGSLEWLPNQEAVNEFLDHWQPILKNGIEDYKFHLAGKGINTAQYSSAKELKVYEVVHDAFTFVRDLDVCVVPLLSGSGIRLKILEAMSAGKLVVTTSIGIQGIKAEDRKHVLLVDNSDQLNTLIQQLNDNTLDIEQIITNAKELVHREYSIVACAKKLLAFYRSRSGLAH